jgi:hypothetical protein
MAGRIAYYGNISPQGLVLNLDAAIVGSYPKTGSTWFDISNNGNNGTLTNGPTFTGSDYGAIVFDGADDYVELLPSYNTITTSGTVEIAIKFNGTNVYKHIWVFDKTDNPEVRLSTAESTGNFGFQVYDNGSYRFNQTPITPIMYNNIWIYVQAVWGNNDYRIYLNGSLVSNQTSGGIITNTGPATTSRLGNFPRAGGSQFNGSIGTFRIYNRALSATEITQNFNALRGRYGI